MCNVRYMPGGNAKSDRAPRPSPATAPSSEGRRRWLVFVHQLPSETSNLRVRTWRRLQQLGAVPIRQAVYVLPDTPGTREDFEWLKQDVKGAGGDATVFAADALDGAEDDAIADEFRRVRQEDYAALASELEQALKRHGRQQRARSASLPSPPRALNALRERLGAIESVDFFGSAGRDRVVSLLDKFADLASGGGTSKRPSRASDTSQDRSYHGRLWITRQRPGVDRMASAWLIRHSIDAEARFVFATDRESVPPDAIPFDMFGVEFSHKDGGCTFETLCSTFSIGEPAVARIAAIVHDLDLKDQRFGAPEAGTVGALIDGLRLAHSDDGELLAQGMTLFDSLYRSFESSVRSAGPRLVAQPKRRRGLPPGKFEDRKKDK
jgi:hypothetical protein